MKVFVLTPELTVTSGWGRYSADLIHALKKQGVHADVATADVLPGALDYRRNYLLAPWYAWQLRKRARACDTIHAFVEPYAPIAYWLSLFARKPYFVTAHGTYAVLPFTMSAVYRLWHRWSFARARGIICVSDYTRRRLAAFGFRNLAVINNGIIFADFSSHTVHERENLIVSVGAVKHRKGQHVSLAAFAQARQKIPTLRYCIVGDQSDSAYVERLKKEAALLGVAEAVEFRGYVSDEDLREMYRRAKVFALTPVSEGAHFEGFGLVYLEAGACGLPVVGSLHSGAEDAIRDGETGFLAPQSDAAAVANVMVKILKDTDLADRLGKAGIAWARAHDWDVIARQYADFICQNVRSTETSASL